MPHLPTSSYYWALIFSLDIHIIPFFPFPLFFISWSTLLHLPSLPKQKKNHTLFQIFSGVESLGRSTPAAKKGVPSQVTPHKVKETLWKKKTKQITREQCFWDQKAPSPLCQIHFISYSFNPNTQVLACDLFWSLGNSYIPCGIFAPISWHCIVV